RGLTFLTRASASSRALAVSSVGAKWSCRRSFDSLVGSDPRAAKRYVLVPSSSMEMVTTSPGCIFVRANHWLNPKILDSFVFGSYYQARGSRRGRILSRTVTAQGLVISRWGNHEARLLPLHTAFAVRIASARRGREGRAADQPERRHPTIQRQGFLRITHLAET